MKKKVMFIFSGTGDSGENTAEFDENTLPYQDNVIRVYIAGCQNSNIGGKNYLSGLIDPDLSVGAKKIAAAFNTDGTLSMAVLRKELGSGLYSVKGITTQDELSIAVDTVCLTGYSRGAVTAFAVAKELNCFGVDINIIANQPVPGSTSEQSFLSKKYHDLTLCNNVKSATTLLASHDLRNGILHNGYFSQMVAQFHPECVVQNLLLPHQNHWSAQDFNLLQPRINIELARLGCIHPGGYEQALKTNYTIKKFTGYTPEKFAQKILGASGQCIKKDPVYLDTVLEKAKQYLADYQLDIPSTLDPEKASAIVAIGGQDSEGYSFQKNQLILALGDDDSAKKFRAIVNKVDEVCDYLVATTKQPTCKIEVDNKFSMEQSRCVHAKFNDTYVWNNKEQRLFYNGNGTVKEILFSDLRYKGIMSTQFKYGLKLMSEIEANTGCCAKGMFF